ncbi:hypothetical protein K488DRAFT_90309 [Vararia minispora EC-137]|uniref:Uncharacterized protein n=1 Tax=Vararia minispora EC-137 TaxID=1314806 RepID=A0ACB8Q9K8_9AGAM|nr:hypothetical protein K488DRAFT_90309 [Vararia minispora EC-137]
MPAAPKPSSLNRTTSKPPGMIMQANLGLRNGLLDSLGVVWEFRNQNRPNRDGTRFIAELKINGKIVATGAGARRSEAKKRASKAFMDGRQNGTVGTPSPLPLSPCVPADTSGFENRNHARSPISNPEVSDTVPCRPEPETVNANRKYASHSKSSACRPTKASSDGPTDAEETTVKATVNVQEAVVRLPKKMKKRRPKKAVVHVSEDLEQKRKEQQVSSGSNAPQACDIEESSPVEDVPSTSNKEDCPPALPSRRASMTPFSSLFIKPQPAKDDHHSLRRRRSCDGTITTVQYRHSSIIARRQLVDRLKAVGVRV